MELKCASVRFKNGVICPVHFKESGKEEVSARNKNRPFCSYAQLVTVSLLED